MTPRTKEQNEVIREQTRQQIIGASLELFGETGYQKTSIASIAKKAGVSKGLIYHYFESKQEILVGIFEMLSEMGDRFIDAGADQSPKERFKTVLEQMFQFIEHQSGLGKLMISLAIQPDAVEALKEQIVNGNQHQIERFTAIFRDIGFSDPAYEAFALGAMLDGIMIGYITMGENYPLERIKNLIFEKYELA